MTSQECVRNPDTLLKKVRAERETGLARQLNGTDAFGTSTVVTLLCMAVSLVYALERTQF
ncbi:hypothetical protein X769_28550 [Mesorhizobium sp. LSJC268A00]|nr:hypothetical protein X769_28550 [Mesorhizobium sp. LSJC268A00]